MRLQSKSYIFLLLFFFVGCVARKTTIEYKERIVRDTVSVQSVKTIIKPVKEYLIVDNPCDSLGLLKSFEKTIKTEKSTVKLYNDKGRIKVDVNIDSIVDLEVNKFKSNYKSEVKTKEVTLVKFRYPLWLIIGFCVSVFLNLIRLKSKFL